MKKLIFLNFLLLSISIQTICFGKSVDENTAKIIGSNHLISANVPGVNGSADLVTSYVATAKVNGQDVVDYYVFNIIGGKGYVMVSGDDNVIPILAYSGESNFDINNIAPSTKYWIEGYQNQITYVIGHHLPAKAGTAESWSGLKLPQVKPKNAARTTTSFPLCTTTWDQDGGGGPGYAHYCPSGTVTGCVPTAMSQVMKFWNWPTVGTGLHQYTTGSYGTLTADFGNTAYNWTEMSLHLTNSCTATDSLMYHAGVSVEAQYGTAASGGTGAYVTQSESPILNCAEYALKTYFHYKSTLHGELRDGVTSALYGPVFIPAQAAYSEASWISMLQTELNAGRPVLYKGQEPSGEGHCWVCDGWQLTSGVTYFHFNWGWSGASDAYYTVDNLAPPALGIGAGSGNFNSDQGVIIGIQPDTYPTVPSGNIQMAAHLDCANNSAIGYSSGFSLVTKITNTNSSTYNGSFCAQVFNMSGNYVGTVNTIGGQTITAGSTSAALTFSTGGMLAMIPGEYYFEVMYQASGTTTWTAVANNGTYINYNLINVRNSSGIELFAPLNVTTGVSLLTGQAMNITTQIINFGSTFHGSVQAQLVNTSTSTSYVIGGVKTSQTINTGLPSSFTFTQSDVDVPPGTYVLAIEHQPGGAGSFNVTGSDYYTNPIIITVLKNVGVSTPSSVADKINVYPNPANDIINIATEGVTVNAIRISDIQGRQMLNMNADNTQSVITVPVSNLAAGVYIVQLDTETGVVTKKIVITK